MWTRADTGPRPTRGGRPAQRWLAGGLAAVALTGCATVNPYHDPRKPHHRPDGFQNRYLEFRPKGLGEVLAWRWASWRAGLPAPPREPVAQAEPDRTFIAANAVAGAGMQPSATWIGHATVLLQFGGLNWLTDPVFSERASPVSFLGPRRAQPPGLALAGLPRIDVVLISHNHYDHLDEASVRALHAQPGGPPLFVVPLGIGPWLAARGIPGAVELDWWDVHRLAAPGGPVEILLTPAQHWSGRGLTDRLATLWGGFAVFAPDFHLFYSGDTGLSRDIEDIARHVAPRQPDAGFDLALLPIGAYEPRWFMASQHVNPAEAVQMHRALRARLSIGVHWGTFELTDESLDEPPRALAQARRDAGLADDAFRALAIGQTVQLPRRTARAAAQGTDTGGAAPTETAARPRTP